MEAPVFCLARWALPYDPGPVNETLIAKDVTIFKSTLGHSDWIIGGKSSKSNTGHRRSSGGRCNRNNFP
jgi:hypothetical protein